MRLSIALAAALLMLSNLGAFAADPPEKLVFDAKTGNITYQHAKHLSREKGDCKVCHEGLFQQAKAPLNYKAGMHKIAEAKKISCGNCHVAGGKAFESKGNCAKCHVKAAAKS